MKAKTTKKKYQEGGEEAKEYTYFLNKRNSNNYRFNKEKEISEKRASRIANRYLKQEGTKQGKEDGVGRDILVSGKNPKKYLMREEKSDYYGSDVKTKKRIIPKIFKTGGQAGTSGTGKYVAGVQTYGAGYKGNPNSPKLFVGVAPAKRKGGSVKSKRK